MAKPRAFTTLPVAMIADMELTALDLRVAAVIALHDGMSAVKGKGGGCYAKNQTLADLVRTDPTNFSKSLSRLIGKGYVTREPQLMDKRRFTLRVQYPADDSWRVDQPSGERVDAHTGEIVGEPAKPEPEIVGDADSKNGGFSRQTARHYISLKEELDSVETGELNSTKWRSPVLLQAADKRETPEGGSGRVSIWAHLPANIERLNLGAQVAKIETAFNAIGRDADRIEQGERERLNSWLYDIFETCAGTDQEATSQQANRLLDEIGIY